MLKYNNKVHTNPSELDQVSSMRSMVSPISVRVKDRLEGASNFNVWKLRIKNILQEHDIEQYVTTVVEEPTNNVGRTAFRKSQAKSK